ncbi:MAG TPA: sigma-54 dependent transcriptional regulator [Steroidobacteraceae bacterium]|nr:sigma-54 dependent transcriptional regulator [Steroidobacteraceae bacterium]
MNTRPATVLVVDDTPTNVGVLLEMLGREGHRVLVARDGESALEQVRHTVPDLVLLDVMMPGLDGFATCQRLRADPATAQVPVIFMTALSDLPDKVRGFQAGGSDYVVKPFEHEEVVARVRTQLQIASLRSALEGANQALEARVQERTAELKAALEELERLRQRLQHENRYLREEIDGAGAGIVGTSAGLREALRRIELVAATTSTVLIHGETGTGKELIARAIHESSPRRDRALVKLNCSAISAGLVESELFGHLKGAFTGASERRIGRFELADGGTLFLDEVSELPPDTQTKLLRVLQEREFEPVGSSKPIRVDVRVVAASNRDLAADVARGRFRADLYYRLNVFPIEVPPLRERREDVPLLARHFTEQASRLVGRRFDGIAADALQRLLAYDWPGNVRELQNVIERAAILSTGSELRVDWSLDPSPPSCLSPFVTSPGSAGEVARSAGEGSPRTLEDVEREHLLAVLRRTRGVIEGPSGAARLLGLTPSTARFRIRKLGIRRDQYLAG